MPILHLHNFGTAGVNVDPEPWKLGPEYLTSAQNVDVTDGYISSDNGLREMGDYLNEVADVPIWLGFERDGDKFYWIVAGTESVVAFESRGDAWGDISNPTGYAPVDAASIWSHCQLSEGVSVLNNSANYPEYWATVGLAQTLQDLPYNTAVGGDTWRSRGLKARWMTSFAGHLLAGNINDNGTEKPNLLMWSHQVGPDQVPTWDQTDTSKLAGEAWLHDDGGAILCAHPLRNSLIVYKRYSTWAVDPTSARILGVSQVFAPRPILATSGALSPHGVLKYRDIHFAMTPGDIVAFDGNRESSIVDGKIRRLLNSTVDPDNAESAYCALDMAHKRIWFCYPQFSAARPTVAVVYDLNNGTWAQRDLGADVRFAAGGIDWRDKPLFSDLTFPYSEWTDPMGGASWGMMVQQVGQITPAKLFASTRAGRNTDGSEIRWRIARTDLQLWGPRKQETVKRLVLDCGGRNVDMSVQVGAQAKPGGRIRWAPAQTFNPSKQREINVTVTGNCLCLAIEGTCSALTTLSGIAVHHQPAGSQ